MAFVQTGVYYPKLQLYMPFYDHTDKIVRYLKADTHYVQDSVAGTNDLEERLLRLVFLNNLNPDWKFITAQTPVLYPNVQGHFELFLDNLVSARVIVITDGGKVNKWWGTPDIGKYGVLRQKRGNIDLLPLSYVNTEDCYFEWEQSDTTGLQIDLQPGVVADVFVNAADTSPANQSKIPPCYYYDQTGTQWAQVPMNEAQISGYALTYP